MANVGHLKFHVKKFLTKVQDMTVNILY